MECWGHCLRSAFCTATPPWASRSNRLLAFCVAFSIAVMLCFAPLSRAADPPCKPGELRVYVKDSQESPVFDVEIQAASTGPETVVRTSGTMGVADFENLPCGSWTIHARKQGFEESASTTQITSGSNTDVTLTLNPKIVHSSIDVTEKPPVVEQSSSESNELHPSDVKPLPGNPPTVADVLPLVPGVVRTPDGELKLDGTGEQRSSLVVNQSDVTDPATGGFGQTVPIDSVETVNVLNTPFLAQYGRFTQSVVAVETRRGGDKWHGDLNDFFPDFRIRSYHMRGIRNETPRAVLSGPLIADRLYFISALQYFLDKVPNRTLGFPYNESKQEWLNSFTQLDFIASPRQIVTATLHVTPEHINFVNPEYFNPQPVTPTYAQHNYIGTISDHFGLWGGTLDSSLSIQRFGAFVGAQGNADMILTPGGNHGNYFSTQNREAGRTEWLEIWSPAPAKLAGTHLVKIGTSLSRATDQGQFTDRPVDILNDAGQELERITFTNPAPYNRTDLEVTAYGQDHWSLTPKIALDYGIRVEHQRLAESLRVAPRAGFAWTPFSNERTVIRAGYGEFYDHIPLDVYAFSHYPSRTITYYAPDGSILGSPIDFVNVIGSVSGPRSFLVRGERVAGDFSPRGSTWNAQIEHSFSRLFRVRGVYTDNRSVGLIMLEPQLLGAVHEIVLNGDGRSRYRQAEVTAKLTWSDAQQLVFSYTHSRAQGNLNGFDSFLGNYSTPVIQPNLYSNLPGDLPNRFLLWGHTNLPIWKLELLPIVEYRNGFPYAQFDAFQNYIGTPYSDQTRFRNFFSADARLIKNFKISPKYTLRLSLSSFNLTNHFNPLAVHDNIADPYHGLFFGNYHRRYRGDFEVIF